MNEAIASDFEVPPCRSKDNRHCLHSVEEQLHGVNVLGVCCHCGVRASFVIGNITWHGPFHPDIPLIEIRNPCGSEPLICWDKHAKG